jgi:hypothetical protein
MEHTLRAWWLRMSAASLRKHLTLKMKYPDSIVEGIMTQFHQQREAQRKVSIRKTVSFGAWQALLAPARRELVNVRVLKSQLKGEALSDSDVRWDALCQYESCIAALIAKLKKVQYAGEHTPGQFVEFLNKELGRHVPNNGAFWVDFVPIKQRRDIVALFAKLPPPARGKKKEPFERRLPRAMHSVLRKALVAQLETAQQTVEVERSLVKNSFDIDRVDAKLLKIHAAKNRLERLPKNAPLPTKWQNLLE